MKEIYICTYKFVLYDMATLNKELLKEKLALQIIFFTASMLF